MSCSFVNLDLKDDFGIIPEVNLNQREVLVSSSFNIRIFRMVWQKETPQAHSGLGHTAPKSSVFPVATLVYSSFSNFITCFGESKWTKNDPETSKLRSHWRLAVELEVASLVILSVVLRFRNSWQWSVFRYVSPSTCLSWIFGTGWKNGESPKRQNTVDGRNPAPVDRCFIHLYPIIYRVSTILSVVYRISQPSTVR